MTGQEYKNREGGVDIEELASSRPKAHYELPVDITRRLDTYQYIDFIKSAGLGRGCAR